MRVIEVAVAGGPEVLRLGDRPAPVAGANEVLIRVAAAGVNRPDVAQRKGLYPPPAGASDIPGLEVSGTVVAVGQDVTSFSVVDTVFALVASVCFSKYFISSS